MATIESPPQTSRALPARLYRDPEIVELEQRRIFERTWQLAAHVSQLPGPGTYYVDVSLDGEIVEESQFTLEDMATTALA